MKRYLRRQKAPKRFCRLPTSWHQTKSDNVQRLPFGEPQEPVQCPSAAELRVVCPTRKEALENRLGSGVAYVLVAE